ncbi:MAG: hydrogenase formation protein HypD [Gammaproteobacteria bacterium]|nr:hydrogenase formation protein HypD [Gammaproteobacteria bacterium]MCW8993323.1 hydrogenase formation protein HypD [Gammaproteobacteria bacterium]
MSTAREWLERLRGLPIEGPQRVMNVCGGHERTISQSGLRSVLPEGIELIPGPGCPVCVCPEEAIYAAIQFALKEAVTVLAYGDMLRVVVNASKGTPRSLEQARAAGGDIRPIASPLDAVAIARAQPEKRVVFLAAGFETTTAPLAAQVLQGLPENLLLLMAGRLTWPAVAMLLQSGPVGFDALIAPGHVAAVMGAEEWRFVSERHQLPVAVAGFSTESLLAAIYHVIKQRLEGRAELENCYPEVVKPGGNQGAQRMLAQVFEVRDAPWRGIGTITHSGYFLRPPWQAHDAALQLPDYREESRRHAGEMPPGCACSEVVLGRIYPNQCPLYGKVCTPAAPVGPCMVSDEGACRIWWHYRAVG